LKAVNNLKNDKTKLMQESNGLFKYLKENMPQNFRLTAKGFIQLLLATTTNRILFQYQNYGNQ